MNGTASFTDHPSSGYPHTSNSISGSSAPARTQSQSSSASSTSSRTVHDGFATIRLGTKGSGGKSRRARSSPAVGTHHHLHHHSSSGKGGPSCTGVCGCSSAGKGVPGHQCSSGFCSGGHHGKGAPLCPTGCCGGLGVGASRAMEPLWEERGGGAGKSPVVGMNPAGGGVGGGGGVGVPRRERTAPWWDIATRRSRYRSCPAFSQASVVSALEQTVSSVTDRLEKLASSPDLKAAEAEELRKTAATLRRQSTAMSHSLGNGLVSLERQMSCDSVSSVSSTVSGASMGAYPVCPLRGYPPGPGTTSHHFHNGCAACSGCRVSGLRGCPGPGEGESGGGSAGGDDDPNKVKKRSWLRNSFRRAFGRKRSKQSHSNDTNNGNSSSRGTSPTATATVNSTSALFARIRNNHHQQTNTNNDNSNPDLPVNHCRNSAVRCLNQQTNNINNKNNLFQQQQSTTSCSSNQSNHSVFASVHQQSSLQPSSNPHLSINPNQLMVGAPLSGASKSLDNLDDCYSQSQCSSARNSGQFTMGDCDTLYTPGQTATLLRRSLQGKDANPSQLEQELAEKQRALTDCQLELLSAQHQLQSRAEAIAKFQSENQSLREERARLVSLLRDQLGPSADTLLAQTLSELTLAPSSVNSTSTLRGSSHKSDARSIRVLVVESCSGLARASDARQANLALSPLHHVGFVNIAPKTNWDDLDGLLFAVVKEFTSQVDPNYDNSSAAEQEESSSNNPSSIYSSLSSKIPKPNYPSVSKNSSTYSAQQLSTSGHQYQASVNSTYSTTHDSNSRQSRARSDSISSSPSMIHCYQLAEAIRSHDLPTPDLLPYGYCVGNVQEVCVWLNGGLQSDPSSVLVGSAGGSAGRGKEDKNSALGDATSVSFATNIPAKSISSLSRLLAGSGRLLVCGPRGCGKSRLVRAVAQHYASCVSSTSDPAQAVRYFTVTGNNSLELCQLLTSVTRHGLVPSAGSSAIRGGGSPTGSSPVVLVIDDLHAASGVAETVQRCLSSTSGSSTSGGPVVIASTRNTPDMYSNLIRCCNFRWTQLSLETEPLRGMLGRVLRRRILTSEISNQKRIPEAHIISDWLVRLWFHLNDVITKTREKSSPKSPGEGSFSKSMFGASVSPTSSLNRTTSGAGVGGQLSSDKPILSPSLLLDCPLGDLTESQFWFLRTWNDKIIPEITRCLRVRSPSGRSLTSSITDRVPSPEGGVAHKNLYTSAMATLRNEGEACEDPVVWVLATYPWPASAECGSQYLRRLKSSEAESPTAPLFPPPFSSAALLPSSFSLPTTASQRQGSQSEGIYAVPVLPGKHDGVSGTCQNLTSSGLTASDVTSQNQNQTRNPPSRFGFQMNSFGNGKQQTSFSATKNDEPQRKSNGREVLNSSLDSVESNDVPSSMALIVPYSCNTSVKGTNEMKDPRPGYPGLNTISYSKLNGYYPDNSNTDNDTYKSLKSFGGYNTESQQDPKSNGLPKLNGHFHIQNLNGNVDQSVTQPSLLVPSKVPSRPRSNSQQSRRPKTISDVIVEENEGIEAEEGGGLQGLLMTSGTIAKRISQSSDSDEMMDTASPSPTTSDEPSEPIYFAIQRRGGSKNDSPDSSDMDTEPIYVTIPNNLDSPPNVVANCNAVSGNQIRNVLDNQKHHNNMDVRNNVLNSVGVGNTVAIICKKRESINDIKDISHELTSTFKPVETSM